MSASQEENEAFNKLAIGDRIEVVGRKSYFAGPVKMKLANGVVVVETSSGDRVFARFSSSEVGCLEETTERDALDDPEYEEHRREELIPDVDDEVEILINVCIGTDDSAEPWRFATLLLAGVVVESDEDGGADILIEPFELYVDPDYWLGSMIAAATGGGTGVFRADGIRIK